MTKETFERKRLEALQYVVTDSNNRISAAISKRQVNNAQARLKMAQNHLEDYKINGFWNNKNIWAYDKIYKDLPENMSVSAW